MTESGQSRLAFQLLEPEEAGRGGEPDFDTVPGIAVNLIGGAAYRYDRHELSGALVFEDYTLDGSTNRTQRGLVGEWAFRMDDNRELGAYLQYSRLHYPGQPLLDRHDVNSMNTDKAFKEGGAAGRGR